ncbi:nitrilase-related carbon-nitrogen hydrolase, partial [Evtepia sp.]
VNASYVAYGHSLVCDPWGTIVAQLDEKEGVIVTDIDLNDLDKYRGQIPILAGRRTDLYRTERLR